MCQWDIKAVVTPLGPRCLLKGDVADDDSACLLACCPEWTIKHVNSVKKLKLEAFNMYLIPIAMKQK